MNIRSTLVLLVVLLLSGCSMMSPQNDQPGGRVRLTFNSNGGTSVSSMIVHGGDTVTMPTEPVRQGYVFFGWYFDDDTFEVPLETDSFVDYSGPSVPARVIPVYARWVDDTTANQTFDVFFDTQGGTVIQPLIVTYGTILTVPTEPTKTGMTFAGWCSDATCLSLYDFTSEVHSDLTLRADWGTTGLIFEDYGGGYEVGQGTIGTLNTVVIPHFHNDRPVINFTSDVFVGNSSVTHLSIPATFVSTYLEDQLKNGHSLEWIEVSPHHPLYTTIDGVLFNKDATTLLRYPGSRSDASYTIPDGTLTIDEHSFYQNRYLESLMIPSSVTTIEHAAISQSQSLDTIWFEPGSNLTTIHSYAFHSNPVLRHLLIPASVTHIEAQIVDGSDLAMVYIEASSPPPNWHALWLEDDNINDGWPPRRQVWGFLERGTEGLFHYVLTTDGAVVLGLIDPATQTHVTIPAQLGGEDVVAIGHSAFRDDDTLTTISLPQSIERIDPCAFQSTGALIDVDLGTNSSLHTIGIEAFAVSALTSFEFPDGLLTIDQKAFSHVDLHYPILPDSITDIGYYAFYNNDSYHLFAEATAQPATWDAHWFGRIDVHWGFEQFLDSGGLTYALFNTKALVLGRATGDTASSIVIPETVDGRPIEGILPYAFQEDLWLEDIALPANLKTIGTSAFQNSLLLRSVTFAPGSQLTSIGDAAFMDTHALEHLILPEGLTTIGNHAFLWAFLWHRVYLPASVTSVGTSAFVLTFPRTIHIGATAVPASWNTDWLLSNDPNELAYLVTGASNPRYEGDLFVIDLVDDSVAILGLAPDAAPTDLVIPAMIDGKPVTSIVRYAIVQQPTLTHLTLPDTMRIIGVSAFAINTNLTTISISPQSQLESIGLGAFSNCDDLTSIYLPIGVTTIGADAFYGIHPLSGFVIHAAHTSQPSTWDVDWNAGGLPVVWNSTAP